MSSSSAVVLRFSADRMVDLHDKKAENSGASWLRVGAGAFYFTASHSKANSTQRLNLRETGQLSKVDNDIERP